MYIAVNSMNFSEWKWYKYTRKGEWSKTSSADQNYKFHTEMIALDTQKTEKSIITEQLSPLSISTNYYDEIF